MYNNVYQEYINNMLGTIPNYNRMEPINFENNINNNYSQNNIYNNAENIEQFYPDLYRLLYPMIQKACMKNTNPLTEDTINNMVEEIYSNFMFEDSMFDEIDSNIDFRSGKISETSMAKMKSTTTVTSKKQERNIKEDREFRQNNFVLRDLIRILILRELLGAPGNRPPNWQGPPFRPLFRQPFNPREFSNNNAIYESSFY